MQPAVLRRSSVKGFAADEYEVQQEFATSKDGTQVPMFIFGRKGFRETGPNPLLLYGYGGEFTDEAIMLLQRCLSDL